MTAISMAQGSAICQIRVPLEGILLQLLLFERIAAAGGSARVKPGCPHLLIWSEEPNSAASPIIQRRVLRK